MSVGFQFVFVANITIVYDLDFEFLSAAGSPFGDAVIGKIVITGNRITVFVVNIQLEVGISVTCNKNTGFFAAESRNLPMTDADTPGGVRSSSEPSALI